MAEIIDLKTRKKLSSLDDVVLITLMLLSKAGEDRKTIFSEQFGEIVHYVSKRYLDYKLRKKDCERLEYELHQSKKKYK